MKRLARIIITIVVLGVLFFLVAHFTQTPQETPKQNTEQSEEGIAVPMRLEIPKIGVNAPIEEVGQDSEGRMATPSLYYVVGWYKLGYRPGHKGSAVLSGHFDRQDGSPAVFYNLSYLHEGDEILVVDTDQKEHRFQIIRKEFYDYDKLPLKEIFDTAGITALNIITCDGTWNSATRNYSQRLVIYAKGV